MFEHKMIVVIESSYLWTFLYRNKNLSAINTHQTDGITHCYRWKRISFFISSCQITDFFSSGNISDGILIAYSMSQQVSDIPVVDMGDTLVNTKILRLMNDYH